MSASMAQRARIGLVVGVVAAALAAQSVAKVGEKVPEFAYGKLLGSDGRTSITELRGNVVMFDWWGNH